ncbi:MAG: hypothetical protein KDD33_12050 [Bdellovibrionales bacterium]|nr:hypothetical protein [Bdellovibrionales bacterium]
MNKAISLSFHGRPAPQRFVVIHSESPLPEELCFLLSPQLMIWSDRCFIFDLDPSLRYWQWQSEQQNLELFEVFDQILNDLIKTPFTACFCQHPFQGLLFASYDLFLGSILYSSSLAQNHFKDFSWDLWISTFQSFLKKQKEFKKTDKDKTQSKLKQMQRSLERLGSLGPNEFRHVEASAIERRYGQGIAQAWRWTFQESQVSDLPLFRNYVDLDGFPWRDHKPTSPPKARRLLDYPLSQWEAILTLLQEDLAKVKAQIAPSIFVQKFEWHLTFYNLEKKTLEVSFRNPHNLNSDGEGFPTTCAQFYYAYDELCQQMQSQNQDLDLPDHSPIIEWDLELTGFLHHPESMTAFWSSSQKETELSILDLENRLPVRLERYQIEADFLVHKSFKDFLKDKSGPPLTTWQLAGRHRPLFIHKKPMAMLDEPFQKQLCEKVISPWWQSPHDYQHSYYKDFHNKQLRWVFQNSFGEWFEQAFYY